MNAKLFVKIKPINREQIYMQVTDLEASISLDHPIRAIWEFIEGLDLTPLYKRIQSKIGEAGCSAHDPKIIMAIWLYAYSDGINSAREVELLCSNSSEGKKSYQWLCGGQPINYHTLSDFRVKYKEELDELFTRILGVLSYEGLITMKRVTQDGTKIKANASSSSFRRKATLEEHLKTAKEQVELLSDPENESIAIRKKKAQQRAAKEKVKRLEKAMEEYKKLDKKKGKKKEIRVSKTDPENRIMKNSIGGYEPSYNVQLATDTENKIIIGKEATNDGSDYNSLIPMMNQVKERIGKNSDQVIADGGYNSYSNIMDMAEKEIDLIAGEKKDNKAKEHQYKRHGIEKGFYAEDFKYDSEKDTMKCPNNKILRQTLTEHLPGRTNYYYLCDIKACRNCKYKLKCCPNSEVKGRSVIRTEYHKEINDFRKKMQTDEAKAIYKKRSENAEFPNAWLKDKFKLRQFRLRGLSKVNIELTIAVIAYNIMQWYRLRWKVKLMEKMVFC